MAAHRRLPVRPDLEQLRREAAELLGALHHGGGPVREYRDVTPLGWGRQYHARIFVSRESVRLIEAAGGTT